MVGAGVVLALGQVDAGLAAVGGVDLGDQRGRHLDDRHAALVEVGAEAGEVADDAAAERDDVVLAGHPGAGQLAQHPLGLGHRLRSPRPGSTSICAASGSSAIARRARRPSLSVTQKRRPASGHHSAPSRPGPTKTGYSPEALAAQSIFVPAGSSASADREGSAR